MTARVARSTALRAGQPARQVIRKALRRNEFDPVQRQCQVEQFFKLSVVRGERVRPFFPNPAA
jgi:hypothetical protein